MPARPALERTSTVVATEGPQAIGTATEEGSLQVVARGHYGIPILGKSLFWDGNGSDHDFGFGGYGYYYVADGIALGAGLNATAFKVPGADTYGLEFEAISRFDIARYGTTRVFWDFTGGWLQSTDGIPPGGTEWNMTFSFGPGIDIPLDVGQSLQISTIYHHKSNALGSQHDRNPSQNEIRTSVGLAWQF
ncbi:MAG: hypothetical protein O2865_15610 [Planctomycetota bacterium]|nr:hypothetical protein [Planctomycetota bacterium]MDA0932445.1 hypothetical protein [Planctomycetota bacterium]MDA1222923.1 hypothetical protein [Planctomycetota bacterium]